MYIKNFFKHLHTITKHRHLVLKGCFKIGLYYQGLVHDLSKYSPTEFLVGVKYFQGTVSPNTAERRDYGFSKSWIHHKGRNKHHYEYWVDTTLKDINNPLESFIICPMPDRYIAESLMDRIAACKVYEGKNYTTMSPINYYNRLDAKAPMHEDTRAKIVKYLTILSEVGEKEAYKIIKKELVKK